MRWLEFQPIAEAIFLELVISLETIIVEKHVEESLIMAGPIFWAKPVSMKGI
jgi:hypothetical protein